MEPLHQLTVSNLLTRVSSSDPTPGGGAVACLVGALSSALGSMVVSVGRNKTDDEVHRAFAESFQRRQSEYLELAAEDEAAFDAVMTALRLPKDDETRAARLEAALAAAADVPLRTAQAALDLLEELVRLAPVSGRSIVSDVGVAGYLAQALLSSSLLNVDINLAYMKDGEAAARLAATRDQIRTRGEQFALDVERIVCERIRG